MPSSQLLGMARAVFGGCLPRFLSVGQRSRWYRTTSRWFCFARPRSLLVTGGPEFVSKVLTLVRGP